ncbi:MAG: hypothetical protein HYU44_07795 [Betaproteobacteria bacterium]|nr:hypothetical protein [Betaproteobacteria bacterium]MBI2290054.1 hypothetical protein [Betaproteobacteria bacterium]
MNPLDPLEVVMRYHQETKHHFSRYARSLGYLDWANQPEPFRRYGGSPLISLAPALAFVSGVPGAFAQQKEDFVMSLMLISTAFAHGGEIGRAAAVPRRSRGPFDSVIDALREAIERKIPGSRAEVNGGGGHFVIEVTSPAFAGRSMLDRHAHGDRHFGKNVLR